MQDIRVWKSGWWFQLIHPSDFRLMAGFCPPWKYVRQHLMKNGKTEGCMYKCTIYKKCHTWFPNGFFIEHEIIWKLLPNCLKLLFELRCQLNKLYSEKIIICILIPSFFGTENCDSGFQQTGLTLDENSLYIVNS